MRALAFAFSRAKVTIQFDGLVLAPRQMTAEDRTYLVASYDRRYPITSATGRTSAYLSAMS
jgi:hypothetical protein